MIKNVLYFVFAFFFNYYRISLYVQEASRGAVTSRIGLNGHRHDLVIIALYLHLGQFHTSPSEAKQLLMFLLPAIPHVDSESGAQIVVCP